MSFATPTAWLLAALAIPIIALYILKVRLRRIPVSTNLFWKQIYDEKPPRSLWRHLRHLLSLLAQLLLLLILIFSIADPYFSWQPLQARRIVLVIDTSASMQAGDVAPSRFEAARDAAHQVLDSLRVRDQVAVVAAGSRPEVVLGMAGHVPTLRRAVDSIKLTDAGSSLQSAINLGRQLIGDHPHGQVLVLTDGCDRQAQRETEPENSDSSTDEIDVQYQTFATSAANIGLTQFQARRSLIDPLGYEILVQVRNASDQSVNARLELELDGVPIDVIPLDLKPEETWTRTIEKTSLAGGALKASLTQVTRDQDETKTSDALMAATDANLLATDDTAWAILPPRIVQDVLIVSPGNLFLQKVFEANPLVQVTVRNDLPDTWPTDAIVVCHRIVPEQLPAGNVLVIDPESSCDQWEIGGIIENPIVTEQDDTSPLMTHIRMDHVLMPEARQLEFKSPATKLAATVSGESVYSIVDRSTGDCLVLSVNLERSDLAFRTAFPILITNALGWFAGLPGELEPSVCTGEMADITRSNDLNATADSNDSSTQTVFRTLISPSQQRSRLVSNQAGPLDAIGIWRVIDGTQSSEAEQSDDASLQEIAVNLANADETDLRPDDPSLPSVSAAVAPSDWFTRPIWFYLIVVACLLSMLEWFLYQRRFIT